MVSSFWDTSENGPARRMYSLTKAGELFLSGWIDVLQTSQKILSSTREGFVPGGVPTTDDSGPTGDR
jgi:DNA-binding PadR family transcriptional regulator